MIKEDSRKVAVNSLQFVEFITMMLQVIMAMIALLQLGGHVPSIAAVTTVPIVYLSQCTISRRMARTLEVLLNHKDFRNGACREILLSMRVVKLNACTDLFLARIGTARMKEIGALKLLAHLQSGLNTISLSLPAVMLAVFFCTFVATGRPVTVRSLMPVFALIDLVRAPALALPGLFSQLLTTRVSINRLNSVMKLEGFESYVDIDSTPSPSPLRVIGSFKWHRGTPVVIQNIDVGCAAGKLMMVTGPVGSGKSSLIFAMLGELLPEEGSMVQRSNKVALFEQTPFAQYNNS